MESDSSVASTETMGPALHPLEEERLAAVRCLDYSNGNDDPIMEAIGRKAAAICGTPVGLVTVVDEDKQYFLACPGWNETPVDRDFAFCSYTILQDDPLVVEDATKDARFANNPGVLGEPWVRFYAGAPIIDAGGLPLGSVCAVDLRPRELSSKELIGLQRLARQAAGVLDARTTLRELFGPFAPAEDVQIARERLDRALSLLIDS